jgi:hypothetical protein
MASHLLIDTYLADLARHRLPAAAIEELADGLTETFRYKVHSGLSVDEAASAAIAEFGSADQIEAAFAEHSPARRAARLVLLTGPAVGICWGASLLATHVWTWRIPTAAIVAYAACLIAAVAILATAATSRTYARTRIAVAGSTAMIALDVTMLITVALLAPTFAWPMAVAIPASLARIGFGVRQLPRLVIG